ncbi:MAG: DMT family transporter [Polyangiales bacterium]
MALASSGFGEICGLVAALTWAVGSLLFTKIGARTSSGAMSLGKTTSAALMLVAMQVLLARAHGEAIVPATLYGRPGALLALSAIVGLAIGDTALFGSMLTLGAPRAMLIHSSAPIFAAIAGRVFLHEQLSLRAIVGIAITVSGIAVVISGRRDGAPLTPAKLRKGVALGLIAAVGQATGSVLSRQATKGALSPIAAASFRLCVGAIALAVVMLPSGHTRAWLRELRIDRTWLRVAGASFIGSCCGLWLAQTSLKESQSVGVAATLLATTPIFLLPLAHLAKIERMTARASFGVASAICGVAALTLR